MRLDYEARPDVETAVPVIFLNAASDECIVTVRTTKRLQTIWLDAPGLSPTSLALTYGDPSLASGYSLLRQVARCAETECLQSKLLR